MDTQSRTLSRTQETTRSFLNQVYTWMAVGLAVTGWIAASVAQNESLIKALYANPMLLILLIILQFAAVIALAGWVMRMSPLLATAIFIGYAALTGLTLSSIFLVYTAASIATTFYVTAGTFAMMSIWGYTTKQDLTGIGQICGMALFGFIIASVVNMFLKSEGLYWLLTYVGVAIFTGLIAYDTQKLKQMSMQGLDDASIYKLAIRGALSLYLDFINLFLLLLRLMGRRR